MLAPPVTPSRGALITECFPAPSQLLSRVFRILRSQNPELAGERRRYTIAPPQMLRDGNKKTIFANLADICKRMHRSDEHVIAFLYAELGTSGSVDGSHRLIIKGRYTQKHMENVLRRYIGPSNLQSSRLVLACTNPVLPLSSRVRHLRDVQVARHAPFEGEPHLLHELPVVRIAYVPLAFACLRS